MFKHYKQEIEQEPCCPLCHKNLDENEGDELKGLYEVTWVSFFRNL